MWNKGFVQALEIGQLVEKLLPTSVWASKLFSAEIIDSVYKADKADYIFSSFISKEWYYIEALQNCREQGITIWIPQVANKKSITFYVCENRHSGEIGFYLGEHTFHGVSKNAYEEGFKSFDSVESCAKGISDWIKSYMNI